MKMTNITGLENIRELFVMWSRPAAAAVCKYEGHEVFGTKERSFTRQSDNEDKELAEELKGRSLPIVGSWNWNRWTHPDFSVIVEIDGTPAEVCFEFGADYGGEASIDVNNGNISNRYGPNPRTPQFAGFPGYVCSRTVDFTIKGLGGVRLKADQIRQLYDYIRSELKDLADWFSFSDINSCRDSQFSAFCDQEKGWELQENFSQDWSYESEVWVGRFWSFWGTQNRALTPEETALMEIHTAMRDAVCRNAPQAGRVFTLDEIRRAERGELKAVIDCKAEEYERAKIERELLAMRPDNILRAAIKERDEQIARKKRAEEARAAAERRAAEEAERARQEAERAIQEAKDKILAFLNGIGDFVLDGDCTVKDCFFSEQYCGLSHPSGDCVTFDFEDKFEANVKKIVRWAVVNGAREPELKTEAA
jgi:hypothetical protein